MVKAAVLGASGGIGQPLSLLLKTHPDIEQLALYDVVNTPGVATDLSHISTKANVTGHLPQDDGLKKALTGANIVLIPAGIPRKPGMTRDDLFNVNAKIVSQLVNGVAEFCPDAFLLVISNPVNSTVPIAAEILKSHNVFHPKKLFGVTTLDIVRAETFIKEYTKTSSPDEASVPVIGGHSGNTIVPLFSKANPPVVFLEDQATYEAIVNRVQYGGDEVVKAKESAGSATLSMAYAAFRFAKSVIKAVKGQTGISEAAFVYLPGIPHAEEISKRVGIDYFSVPLEIGPDGIEKAINVIEGANDVEKAKIDEAIKDLEGNIVKGVNFTTAAK